MNYQEHQGVCLSEIGVGCYALGGVFGKKDVDQFTNMLQRACELGVNFFDTAEAYGEAEKVLGEALRPYRQQVHIATKVGVREGLQPNLSRPYIRAACEQSLQALQVEIIDLYQVHFDDPTTPVEEAVAALEDLVQAGKIRRYGLGHLPLEKVKQYIEKGFVFSVLMELSAVERSALESLLPACRDHGVGAIAFSVAGRGMLSGKMHSGVRFEDGDIRRIDPLFQRERFRSGLRIAQRLGELGSAYGKTTVQAAIAWVLGQPGVVCALTGPSSISHLEENLGGSGWTFSGEDWQMLDSFLRDEQASLRQEQLASVREILLADLSPDPHAAFTDLVYAIETAILTGLTAEEQVIPLFYELFALRKQLDDPSSLQMLKTFQGRLSEMIV